MAKQLQIRYTIQSGSLPNGLTLNPDTGVISGAPGWDALGLGPSWTGPTAGSLGSFNEGDTFTSVTFTATSTKTPVRFSLATDQDRLPWGLSFNPITGVLSGTIAPLKQRTREAASTSDGPTWTTAFGKLAGYDEGSSSSIQLTATPLGSRTIKSFQIVDGYLPWGLKLNMLTGVISGMTAPLKNPGAFVDVPKLPVPVWSTAVDMGTFNEYDAVSTTIAAVPDTGRSMAKYVIRAGGLPWGLKLNSQTGAITGTISELRVPNDPAYVDSTKNPVFSGAVTIQGSTVAVGSGDLGSYAKGTNVTINFGINPANGTTLQGYYIASGSVPTGLTLSKTGVLTGTILNNARVQSKTYSFTLGAWTKDTSVTPNISYYVTRNHTITVQ